MAPRCGRYFDPHPVATATSTSTTIARANVFLAIAFCWARDLQARHREQQSWRLDGAKPALLRDGRERRLGFEKVGDGFGKEMGDRRSPSALLARAANAGRGMQAPADRPRLNWSVRPKQPFGSGPAVLLSPANNPHSGDRLRGGRAAARLTTGEGAPSTASGGGGVNVQFVWFC